MVINTRIWIQLVIKQVGYAWDWQVAWELNGGSPRNIAIEHDLNRLNGDRIAVWACDLTMVYAPQTVLLVGKMMIDQWI